MIITRTPFRVSFLGGGTDIPWFYENHGGGAVISTAIDRYMYLSAHPMFANDDLLLKYSATELVKSAADLRHPIAREVLVKHDVRGLDISVSADIPAGTGLGSSSAFTVGLTQLVHASQGRFISKASLANEACHIELDLLKEPIGKQDQYASAFGGVNLYSFLPNGQVDVTPLVLDSDSIDWLNSSMVLVRVGSTSRSASDILRHQGEAAKKEQSIVRSLSGLRDLTLSSFPEIQADITRLGEFLNESWELKKASSPSATSAVIDSMIEVGLRNGALGAKLLGAGQGGFVLFLVNPSKSQNLLQAFKGAVSLRVETDQTGSCVVYYK